MKTPSRLATSACTVLLALCLMTVSSCRQGRGGTTADTPAAAVNWEDSAAALSTRANNYFNSLQLDSLELFVPEAKQICLDHGLTVPYYQIWTTLTELYIASDDFEKGSAEAKLMMEDALRRHSAYGLSSAYKMLGLGYAFSENFEEGVKYLRKAVDTYPQNEGEELDTIDGRSLFLYTDGLNEAENTEQKQFGDEHMLSILSSHRSLSARQVIEHMTAQVEQHRNGAAPNDDLTMMCLTLNLDA